mmetsp:Transcript_23145/g.64213  ORF Transcript_23145/g.64213 Transcript_23145/m.64213 type:complete len:204 (-) Transcript_23145:257-868(-)
MAWRPLERFPSLAACRSLPSWASLRRSSMCRRRTAHRETLPTQATSAGHSTRANPFLPKSARGRSTQSLPTAAWPWWPSRACCSKTDSLAPPGQTCGCPAQLSRANSVCSRPLAIGTRWAFRRMATRTRSTGADAQRSSTAESPCGQRLDTSSPSTSAGLDICHPRWSWSLMTCHQACRHFPRCLQGAGSRYSPSADSWKSST